MVAPVDYHHKLLNIFYTMEVSLPKILTHSWLHMGKNGSSCRFSPSDVSAYIPGGAYNITAYDEDELY